MVKVRLQKYITGYNPPENYVIITDVTTRNKFRRGVGHTTDITAKHSITNNVGTVIVSKPSVIYQAGSDTNALATLFSVYDFTVVTVDDPDNRVWYCGIINSIRTVSSNVYEITYAVDWYTSTMLTNVDYGSAPNIETIMYKRKTDGEYNYSDEGMTPRTISMTKGTFQVRIDTSDPDTGTLRNFFNQDTDNVFDNRILVYHESNDNATMWIFVRNVNGAGIFLTPEQIWTKVCDIESVPNGHLSRTFNPKGVLFYGCFPYNPYIVPVWNVNVGIAHSGVDGNGNLYCYMTSGGFLSGSWFSAGTSAPARIGYFFTDVGISKEYAYNRLVGAQGNILYDIPLGYSMDRLDFTAEPNLMETAPSVTFILGNGLSGIGTQMSFSVPFASLTYFIDSEAVYFAEDRVYNKEMRNLNNTNELMAGVIGGANQGAMISAFSRSEGVAGLNKGVIGGGVAVISSVANYEYNRLYADKEAERIEDNRAKVKADTLLLAGGVSDKMSKKSGVYTVSYDTATITAIQAYQSRFGYQTNAIGSNVALNSFSGYVQGEVILAPGLRTEIESYIMSMFRNGVKFNAI